jgi:predicted MFS family arabinose efflux permease
MGVADDLSASFVLRFVAGVLSAWTLVATSAWALRELARDPRPWLRGIVYSGVGLGIAIVGVFCILAARPGISVQELWIVLGAVTAIITAPSALLLVLRSAIERGAEAPGAIKNTCGGAWPRGCTGIVICYALFGFGYILPATFLPVLARHVVDDPRLFGLAWPIFGIAAAASTVFVAFLFDRINRLRVWACCHLLMAAGIALPTFWLSLEAISIAASLVGGTFMVITMVGLQEARSRFPDNPTAILGQMTAAFAIGQFAGPLVSGALDHLPIGPVAALGIALQVAVVGLAMSAVALWRFSRPHSVRGALKWTNLQRSYRRGRRRPCRALPAGQPSACQSLPEAR